MLNIVTIIMSQTAAVVDMPVQANDDIAVVGFSFRLPQDVNDDMSFWEVLDGRRNLMTSFPDERMDAKSFLDTNATKVLFAFSSCLLDSREDRRSLTACFP